MAIPNSGQLKLRGTIGAEYGLTGANARLNAKFGGKIGKAAGATTRMGDFYGAVNDPLPGWIAYVDSKTASDRIGDAFVSVGWHKVTSVNDSGVMYGSPRSANNHVTSDSRYNRVVQHGVDSIAQWQWLVANPDIPTLVYAADGGQFPSFQAWDLNGYQSLGYYSSYSSVNNFVIEWLTSDGTAYTRTKNGAATVLNYY